MTAPARYKYEIINIPWVNSTVDVWLDDGNEPVKTRLQVLGLRSVAGTSLKKLSKAIKVKFSLPLADPIDVILFEP